MIYVLIGHRGAGKTGFLARVAAYYKQAKLPVCAVDLDEYLGQRHGDSPSALFVRHGEAAFRALEAAGFAELFEKHRGGLQDTYIALGAGFAFELPPQVHPIWIRRPTDAIGRIFLDRPRLHAELSPLQEYHRRYAEREPRYAALSRDVWEVAEGMHCENDGERLFVLGALAGVAGYNSRTVGGILTLLPQHFQRRGDAMTFADWLKRRLRFRNTRFELRDDLLDQAQIALVLATVPAERLIYSFRRPSPSADLLRWVSQHFSVWDYPLELGPPPLPLPPPILSLHKRISDETAAAAAARLCAVGQHLGASILKLAIVIADFAELLIGHAFTTAEPKQRAFLPRSEKQPGRWTWYRLVRANQPLAFFREGEGSCPDQPCLADFLRAMDCFAQPAHCTDVSTPFAAVLGDPVLHSRTPVEHFSYFRDRGMPVVAISMTESEWQMGGLKSLTSIGLRCAAVTAPLKNLAAQEVGFSKSGLDAAVNTLFFDAVAKRWRGTYTDPAGAKALLGPWADQTNVAIWGGGGTLAAIAQVLPRAQMYQARNAAPRHGTAEEPASPRILIWAVGRSRQPNWPPPSFAPELVIDLNYSEDSPGREYALAQKARYVSGDAWFAAQAAEQRRFFSAEQESEIAASASAQGVF